jgi:signal transduction histidine kinase
MELLNSYSRRCAELAIASLERYKSDVLFRVSVSVVALLILLGVVSLTLFVLLWQHLWLTIFGLVATWSVFGYLLFRFMLLPTQNTLHYQKLFISNVAHELRTPLSTIKTGAEVALLDEKMPSATQKMFREIIRELDRISEIINNLLSLNNLTRPERIRFGNVDLAPIVETAVGKLALLAQERKIYINFKKEPHTIVWGNGTALEQMVTNLVKNALVYTQKNSNGNVGITIGPDYQGSIIFTVTDNGIGITQKDLDHIFEPFYRADVSRVRNVRSIGSGLGLAIVNELVRAHRGKIHIESARNQGTIVSVSLPMGVIKEIKPEIASTKNSLRSQMSVDFSESLWGMLRSHE